MRLRRLPSVIWNREWEAIRWALKSRWRRPSDKPHDWRLERPADVLIVGAAKCGTSSLHKYLAQHPQIHGTSRKEHHYFDQIVEEILRRGMTRKNRRLKERYQRDLDRARSGQLRLESTPAYLIHPEFVARAFQQNPHTKIVAMRRDHADRLRSDFLMYKRIGFEQRTFEEFQREGIPFWEKGVPYGNIYLRHGMYDAGLDRILALFPSDQVFSGTLEDMSSDPLHFMKRISSFLGVESKSFETVDFERHNAAWRNLPSDWIPDAREAIYKFYKKNGEGGR